VRLPSKKYSFYAERSVSRLLWLDFPQGRFGLARGIGAETLARAMIIIETAKMNALNLQAYLPDLPTSGQPHPSLVGQFGVILHITLMPNSREMRPRTAYLVRHEQHPCL